jgi:hypothetical protein
MIHKIIYMFKHTKVTKGMYYASTIIKFDIQSRGTLCRCLMLLLAAKIDTSMKQLMKMTLITNQYQEKH